MIVVERLARWFVGCRDTFVILLSKYAQDGTIHFADGAILDLVSTFGAANLMPTGNQDAVHVPFATEGALVVECRRHHRLVQFHGLIIFNDRCHGGWWPIESSLEHGFQRLGSQCRIFDIVNAQAFADQVKQNVGFWFLARHGQIEQGTTSGRLDGQQLPLGVARDGNWAQVSIDQPADQVERSSHDGAMDREPV